MSENYFDGALSGNDNGFFFQYNRFLEYIRSHQELKPLNYQVVASDLGLSNDQVLIFFQQLKKSFRLFLDSQNQLQEKITKEINNIYFQSLKKDTFIEISKSDMNALADFHYLTSLKPWTMKAILMHSKIKTLFENYQYLFDEKESNRWVASAAGGYFSSEWKNFQILNQIPDVLEFNNLKLKIKR